MADTQSTQPELFDVAELPGRPMLHWHGKRPLREIPYYPAQLRERYGSAALTTGGPHPPPSPLPLPSLGEGGGARRAGEGEGWTNRLYWGDNLQVMAHLMREFRGQIKLIYIDPPFDSGADYRKRVKLRGASVETDLSVLEERQYTDIWSNDLYLQYIYERLILMRELLAEDGFIVVHINTNRAHYMKVMMDEIYGDANFRNEIVVKRIRKSYVEPSGISSLNEGCDYLLLYSKSTGSRLNPPLKYAPKEERWHSFDAPNIRPNLTYELFGKWPPEGRCWMKSPEEAEKMIARGDLHPNPNTGWPEYRIEATDYIVRDTLWDDITASAFTTGYPTEKKESMLEVVLAMASSPGDLVADFFIGSGTTAAVAQQLGRRWIGADINLGAIHTTAQRLARIIEEQQQAARQLELIPADQPSNLQSPISIFEVYNVNHYEVFKNAEEARDIVLQLYGVEPLKGHRFFDGVLDGRWVKVVDLNRICSKLDIQTIFDNLPPDDLRGVVVLCAGHEYDVPEAIKQRNLLDIPFEVRDILTDRKDVIFKRPPEAQVSLTHEDGLLTLTVEQFYSPLLLQKLSLEDASASSARAEAIDDWRQTVASVLVDPAYDGQVFQARITDTPARRDELVRGEYTWEAGEYGEGQVAVKIVDVLDEEWFGVVEG